MTEIRAVHRFFPVGQGLCPSPLELGHYIGRERGIGHGEEATFRRRHPEAAA